MKFFHCQCQVADVEGCRIRKLTEMNRNSSKVVTIRITRTQLAWDLTLNFIVIDGWVGMLHNFVRKAGLCLRSKRFHGGGRGGGGAFFAVWTRGSEKQRKGGGQRRALFSIIFSYRSRDKSHRPSQVTWFHTLASAAPKNFKYLVWKNLIFYWGRKKWNQELEADQLPPNFKYSTRGQTAHQNF